MAQTCYMRFFGCVQFIFNLMRSFDFFWRVVCGRNTELFLPCFGSKTQNLDYSFANFFSSYL